MLADLFWRLVVLCGSPEDGDIQDTVLRVCSVAVVLCVAVLVLGIAYWPQKDPE